ncbi:hypothetical protein UFOVP221_45 [uncultured Caudovirales phage]|uniref:Uncharacterized protein n=1 Tax=uncultured Caudovirales phage TaxID=2100421 RepID=A0A6J7WMF1_9CAUD|nr:hypothetical protein UFOVP221_45 [uncultured Caudovirales phage]
MADTPLGGINWRDYRTTTHGRAEGISPENMMELRLGGLKRRVAERPEPEHIDLHHTYDPQLEQHTVSMHDTRIGQQNPNDPQPYRPDLTNRVGEVKWYGNTGEVAWTDVDSTHRQYTSHMMDRAHDVAKQHGHVGPLWADNLTDYSHKLLEKFNPDHLGTEHSFSAQYRSGFNPSIHGIRSSTWDTLDTHVGELKSQANEVQANLIAARPHDTEHVTDVNSMSDRLKSALTNATTHANRGRHGDAKRSLQEAGFHASRLADHAYDVLDGNYDHPAMSGASELNEYLEHLNAGTEKD